MKYVENIRIPMTFYGLPFFLLIMLLKRYQHD